MAANNEVTGLPIIYVGKLLKRRRNGAAYKMAEIIKEDFSKQKCGVCHKRFATKYCDFVIQYSESPTFICGRTAFQDFMESQQQLTCDCALCDECAKNHGLIDFCPYHEKIMQQEKINTPDYIKNSRGETWRKNLENEAN